MAAPIETRTIQVHDLTFEPFIDASAIAERVQRIASEIDQDYKGKDVVLIGVLKGAFVFLGDLVKCLKTSLEVEFIRVSSYEGTTSSGKMNLSMDFPSSIADKHIIIVEDIVDSGLTADFLMKRALTFKPASVAMASLFVKPDALKVDIKIDYVGMEIPDRFIIGYGLDYNEKGRELAAVYSLSKK